MARLLAGMGIDGPTPLLARFSSPLVSAKAGESLAGRPVSRPARGMGRPVSVLPLVTRACVVDGVYASKIDSACRSLHTAAGSSCESP